MCGQGLRESLIQQSVYHPRDWFPLNIAGISIIIS